MQNWKLRHIYEICFLIFWAVFCAFGFKVWKKYKYDLKNFFFFFNQKRCQKTQNFTLILNPLKKLLKKAPKKVRSKTSLTNMSISEKSAYFRHVFGAFFQTFFNGFEISVKFCVFWDPKWIFDKKKFFCSYYHFLYTLIATAQETAQKNGKSFFMYVKFSYATIKGFA